MGPLAITIYPLLVAHVRTSASPVLSYSELVGRIKGHSVNPRSPALHVALGEIVTACRTKRLPAIAAIVINAKFKRPGGGYYAVAHPGVSVSGQRAAWDRELADVLAAKAAYPTALT